MTRKPLGILSAVVAFAAVMLAGVALLPYVLGLFYGCLPPIGSCGDGVGWAMLLSAPFTLPVIIALAGVTAMLAYRRVAR